VFIFKRVALHPDYSTFLDSGTSPMITGKGNRQVILIARPFALVISYFWIPEQVRNDERINAIGKKC
jgi:hypothetical protein